mmetsp:Transcript_49327/g.106845  ORF Transcript_49327/g.106845 Transcript_49327/m.106845 type:complete len:95 (+) Transcript_49327:930-1214(+)
MYEFVVLASKCCNLLIQFRELGIIIRTHCGSRSALALHSVHAGTRRRRYGRRHHCIALHSCTCLIFQGIETTLEIRQLLILVATACCFWPSPRT